MRNEGFFYNLVPKAYKNFMKSVSEKNCEDKLSKNLILKRVLVSIQNK